MGLDKVTGLFFFLLSIYVCIESYQYGLGTFSSPKAGLFPFLSGLILAFFSFLGFFEKISLKEAFRVTGETVRQWNFRKVFFTLCALFFYAFLFEILGFLICTFLLVFFVYEVIEPKRIRKGVLVAILSTAVSYLIFKILIKVEFPGGLLGF